jgi:hypothetical protein
MLDMVLNGIAAAGTALSCGEIRQAPQSVPDAGFIFR